MPEPRDPVAAPGAEARPPALSQALAELAEPFEEDAELARMIDRFAGRRVICLGESTHGSREFYRARAAITERLAREHGFTIVAVEADWPDAAAYDASIREGTSHQLTEEPFARFPRWMWRNEEVWDLLRALREINRGRSPGDQVGFFGLDVYSLCASIDAVLDYLERTDPKAAEVARGLYGCLKPHCDDPGGYVRSRVSDRYADCEDRVAQVLSELQSRRVADGEPLFDAQQNARVVQEAEKYYRSMYYASVSSWNLRDRHMFDTLERLLENAGPQARAVVWAHNSHVGDASATDMGRRRGELNIGQLVRERWGEASALIGFSTNEGEVAAADHWGGPMRVKRVRRGLPDSLEDHARRAGPERYLVDMSRADAGQREALSTPRLQRAIGVIYRPETERLSHYYEAELAAQFDAWVWFAETTPVRAGQAAPGAGAPDLFPFGV
ncbi:MAG: erythromycin esterase family protein [Pseudomonadota bacterium]